MSSTAVDYSSAPQENKETDGEEATKPGACTETSDHTSIESVSTAAPDQAPQSESEINNQQEEVIISSTEAKMGEGNEQEVVEQGKHKTSFWLLLLLILRIIRKLWIYATRFSLIPLEWGLHFFVNI